MRCRLRAVLLSRLGDSGRAGRPAFEPSRRHVFEAGPPPSTLLCSVGPNLINPKAIAVPLCGRRHTGELEFARDPGLQYCYPQVCYFVRVRVPCKTARWAVDFTGAHCGHVIQPWKRGFQPYLLTGGPSGPVPGWLPWFLGPLRRLRSGPPALRREVGLLRVFSDRGAALFDSCYDFSVVSSVLVPQPHVDH